MTDLLNRLSVARPTDTELEAMWSVPDRAALVRRIDAAGAVRSARYRTAAALGLAAAAVTAFSVIPVAVDTPEAAAADLRALALTAASYDGPVLQEGAWLHERSETLQRNSPTRQGGDGGVYDRERETWTRWDGRVLLVEYSPSAGWTSYDVIDGAHAISDIDAPAFDDPASFQDPTPRFAATLPDTTEGLLSYLDERVFGSSSHDEALYHALIDLATSHTLPPATLAATFGALAEIDGVRTDDVRVQGESAVEVSFAEDASGSVDTMVVDAATGQVLSMREESANSTFTSTTTLSEVVPAIPSAVVDAFGTHREGVRYDASGGVVPA